MICNNKVYLAVNKNGDEVISSDMLIRNEDVFNSSKYAYTWDDRTRLKKGIKEWIRRVEFTEILATGTVIKPPRKIKKGSIYAITGKHMTYNDEPVLVYSLSKMKA